METLDKIPIGVFLHLEQIVEDKLNEVRWCHYRISLTRVGPSVRKGILAMNVLSYRDALDKKYRKQYWNFINLKPND